VSEDFPEVAEALKALEEAVDEAWPPWVRERRVRQTPTKRRLWNNIAYGKRVRAALEQELKQLKEGTRRQLGHRMTPYFLAKVALSSPAVSARGFAKSWADLVGKNGANCSRFTISRVRDAFA